MTTGNNHDRIAYPTLPDPITAQDLKQRFTPWRDEIEWAFECHLLGGDTTRSACTTEGI